MPTISRFYGIRITMYFREHPPPHFHAIYGEYEAIIDIDTGALIEGELPGRGLALVRQWWDLHRDELIANWARAQAHTQLAEIEPLA